MKKKKSPPILLTDDISSEPGRENRSQGVKTCAVRLAERLGSSIDLVHIEDLYLYPVKTPYYKPMLNRYFSEQKMKLGQISKSLQVPSRSMFLNGDPVKKILALSSKRGAYEMIALGTHGRSGLKRLILGSVAEEVIRNAKIPVLTVGPQAQAASSQFLSAPALTILLPTGLTANSDRAEAYALSLAKRLGAKLVLFHCMHEALHPVLQTAFAVPGSAAQLNGFFDELKMDTLKRLKRKADLLSKKGVPTSFVLDDKTTTSSEAVVREAKTISASLIVMGTHGRSLVAGAFFGRTARGVILEASVPVITVRSKES